MGNTFFNSPPALSGTAEDQLRQLYGHLFELSDKLNAALMDISIEQLNPEARVVVSAAAQADVQIESNAEALKTMIVKNAEIVRASMEEIRTTLSSNYTAISEQFGTYQENIEAQIAATSTGIDQAYSLIQTVQAAGDDNAAVLRKLNANIFSGIIDTNTGEVGIAIGYNVTNNDGTLNDANKMATFTADRLTFYIGETPVAWFGNSVFHISDGEVTSSMRMGSYLWKVMANGSMGLMKA